MERTIFDDLFSPQGMTGDTMSKWLDSYLIYDSKIGVSISKLRQFVLFDALMNYSPTFRRDLNEYRKEERKSAIKLDCTLNEINKIFDKVYENETEHKLSDPKTHIDWDAGRICIDFLNEKWKEIY